MTASLELVVEIDATTGRIHIRCDSSPSLRPQLELATTNGGYRIHVRCDVPPTEPEPAP
jgi:hypothetical protein